MAANAIALVREGRASAPLHANLIGAVAPSIYTLALERCIASFDEQGFFLGLYPLITASDTEGAGEMFASQRWI